MVSIESFMDGLRRCLRCQTLFKCEGLMCFNCYKEICRLPTIYQHNDLPFPFRYLFHLTSNDSAEWRLIWNLKGGRSSNTFTHMARQFEKKYIHHISAKATLVPAPSHHWKGKRHHGTRWAEALSEVMGCQVANILEADDTKAQRSKTRQQRKKVQFHCKSSVPLGPLILADDVVTSGGTAMACWRALGKPKDFQVFSMAYRPLTSKSFRV